MARKLVLASHGKFASGIFSSLQLICGTSENISTLDCYLTEDFDLSKTVEEIMMENQGNEIVIVTDLFGGSINNEFLKYINQPNFYLVAGLNLPFLIDFVTNFELAESLELLIQQSLETSKKSIQFCNDSIKLEIDEEEF